MRALADTGISTEGLVRADSVTNEVWLTPHYVVRVNRDAGFRLYREAILSHVLPSEVGYPTLVQHGGELGDDWLVVERKRGVSLSRAWPSMSVDARRRAVGQVAERLKAVHSTVCPQLDGLNDVPQLLDPAPRGALAVARLVASLEKLAAHPMIDAGLMRDAVAHVDIHADALDPFDVATVVHGDLTFENVLWDGEQVTALLDFEFARPGPPDLDLDVLLRFLSMPELHVAADYEAQTRAEDYAEVPWWFAEDYPELFAHPRQLERVRLYSLAWDAKELLQFPPTAPARELHRHHPYRRVANLLNGNSYLDRLNGASVMEF